MARMLEIIDRRTGELERIPEDSGNCTASISLAADRMGIDYGTALAILNDGGDLITTGFIRRWQS